MKSFRPASRHAIFSVALATLLTGSAALHAQAAEDAVEETAPVADTMHKLAGDVQVLLPLIYRYEEGVAPADKEQIVTQIGRMLAHVDVIATKVAPKSDTYQISYDTLVTQLSQAQQEFASGRDAQGVAMLRSATSVCATCHTQDERVSKWLTPPSDGMSDPFVAGEFLFMTRQYDKAFESYRTWLRRQDKLAYEERPLTAFSRLLLTALQMQKSAPAITAVLGEFTAQDNVDRMLKKELIEWQAGIADLQQLTDITQRPESEALQALARQWLSDDGDQPVSHLLVPERDRPRIVWLRGQLYQALMNETDRDNVADWLYWLAVSDRVLEYRFYYSLADMYLKQCMIEYTNDPIAQRCYQEYEDYVEFFYSGSSGTHIPEEVTAELKMLKARVTAAKKVEGK